MRLGSNAVMAGPTIVEFRQASVAPKDVVPVTLRNSRQR